MARVSSEEDHKVANIASGKAPDLAKALEELEHDGKTVSKAKLLRFSPDGEIEPNVFVVLP